MDVGVRRLLGHRNEPGSPGRGKDKKLSRKILGDQKGLRRDGWVQCRTTSDTGEHYRTRTEGVSCGL